MFKTLSFAVFMLDFQYILFAANSLAQYKFSSLYVFQTAVSLRVDVAVSNTQSSLIQKLPPAAPRPAGRHNLSSDYFPGQGGPLPS